MSSLPYKRSRVTYGSNTRGKDFHLFRRSTLLRKLGTSAANVSSAGYETCFTPDLLAIDAYAQTVPVLPQSVQWTNIPSLAASLPCKQNGVLAANNSPGGSLNGDLTCQALPEWYGGESLSALLFGQGIAFSQLADSFHPEIFQYQTWDFKKIKLRMGVKNIYFLSGTLMDEEGPEAEGPVFIPQSFKEFSANSFNNQTIDFHTWTDPTNIMAQFATATNPANFDQYQPVDNYLNPGSAPSNFYPLNTWLLMQNRGMFKRVKHSHGRPASVSMTVFPKKASFSWDPYLHWRAGDPYFSSPGPTQPLTQFLTNLCSSAPGNPNLNTGASQLQMPVDMSNSVRGVGKIYMNPSLPASIITGMCWLTPGASAADYTATTPVIRVYVEYEFSTSVTIRCRDRTNIPFGVSASLPTPLPFPTLRRAVDDVDEADEDGFSKLYVF